MNLNLVQALDRGPLAVSTQGLKKRFGREVALAGLDLTVPEGALYILVGPNGAGKTTTLRILMDLVRADGGAAEVLGRSAREDGPRVRAAMGYLADSADFGYGKLRVSHLLDHHRAYFPSWDAPYAAKLVQELEVPLQARFANLSRGQARRVQLVQALAHRPALLLLDEPTDGLDPLVRDRVLALIADHLAQNPTTVLLSTHHVHEVEGLADCLGVLRRGRLIAQQERRALEDKLRRVRGEVGESWEGREALEPRVVHGKDGEREIDWVVWGEPQEVRQELVAQGVQVREMRPLSLEDATRALLRMEAL